ncbi:hypothetical protein GQ53DRAFT_846984 [Thozetella sp. PMI_491]|nr:hypothetical protein GQ53DRAFT_846984 [Thozetella sp. PMI_491]
MNLLAIAFVDATTKLAHGCFQLYQFWESVRDAPSEVNIFKNDLQILTKILEEIGDDKDLSPSVRLALASCETKLEELLGIVQDLDASYSSATSRRQRLWAAFRMTTKNKQIQSFQAGLQGLKSTLMLGLACQNLQRPSLCFTNDDIQAVRVSTYSKQSPSNVREQIKTPVLTKADQTNNAGDIDDPPPYTLAYKTALQTGLVSRRGSYSSDMIASSPRVQDFLNYSLHLAIDNLFKSGTIEQLMDESVNQMTSFDVTCRGSYGEDGSDIQNVDGLDEGRKNTRESGSNASRGGGSPALKRARVCHRTSSMGVLFGSIWVRTSTLKVEDDATAATGRAEVITSFMFYPSSWLGWFGVRFGTEANLKFSPETGWKFNITPVRAVPENSLIFELCRLGDVPAIKLLLSRGDASVKDTSPEGWTPLHFAASCGHVDLSAALIEAGADKTALVYRGPSEDALSPIAIWAELCRNAPAADKIRMLRVFYDCLDLAEASGDGWFVIHALVSSMSYEKVPMKDTGVSWILRTAEKGMLVGMGARTIWDGLQHAVRGSLFHEHENLSLHRCLGFDANRPEFGLLSQTTALSNMLAVGACAEKLLPLPIEAAVHIGINGFDTRDEYKRMSRRQFIRTVPELYVAWCKALPRAFEMLNVLIAAELELFLDRLGLDRGNLSERITLTALHSQSPEDGSGYQCAECSTSYANIGAGLVHPRRVSFEECRKKEHKMLCQCREYLQALGVTPNFNPPPAYSEWEEAEEELCTVSIDPLNELCEAFDNLPGSDNSEVPFHSTILTLFRAQGRRWLGEYSPTEKLCGVCFLKREQYLGSDGSAAGTQRYTPLPEYFVSVSNRAAMSTF